MGSIPIRNFGNNMSAGGFGGTTRPDNTGTNQTSISPAADQAALIEERARQIANDFIAQLASQNQTAASGRVFTRFDMTSDVIENQKNSCNDRIIFW